MKNNFAARGLFSLAAVAELPPTAVADVRGLQAIDLLRAGW